MGAVRADLGALLVARILPAGGRLRIAALAAELEALVLRSAAEGPDKLVEPTLGQAIQDELAAILERAEAGTPAALIVQPAARRPVAQLLGTRFPDTPVLSVRELPDSQPIEVLAAIGGASEPSPAAAVEIA